MIITQFFLIAIALLLLVILFHVSDIVDLLKDQEDRRG